MRLKTVATLFLAVSLTSLAAGCSSTKSDQALTTDIQAKMFSDPQVKTANVNVSVKDGEATLTGDVSNEGARFQAYKLASDTPGVKHVVDQMTMQAAQAAPMAPPVERVAPAPVASTKQPSQQGKLEELLKYCDERCRDIVRACGDDGRPLPEVGYELQDDQGRVCAEAELAWPTKKVAILLPEQDCRAAIIFPGRRQLEFPVVLGS